MCNHPPEKITFIAGSGQVFPSGEVWKFDDIWYCSECGESFDRDPALEVTEEDIEALELEEPVEEEIERKERIDLLQGLRQL